MPSTKPFQVLFRGFDCLVTPSEEGTFDVSLFEGGSHVFTQNISIDLEKFDSGEEIDSNSEALINEAAQAAVDMFESSRGTLGQGAMALQQKASKMDKKAYFASLDYESWFLNFKGGKFEAQAISLLEQYVTASHEISKTQDSSLDELNKRKGELEYEIDMLNIKRMQSARGNETVIVIRSSKEACFGYVEEIVEKFKGTPNEGVVLKKMQEYLEINNQINAYYNSKDDSWKKVDEITKAMDELLVTAMQTELDESIVDMGGATAYPNMAADVMELMEGVTLDAPLEPTHEMPMGMFARKNSQSEEESRAFYDEQRKKNFPQEEVFNIGDRVLVWPDDPNISWVGTITFRKGWDDYAEVYKYKVKDEETGNSKIVSENSMYKVANKVAETEEEEDEHPMEELGEVHEFLDPAEVPYDDLPFHLGDEVTLTKSYELTLWGGATEELPKGMKGKIKNLYDGSYDAFMVECEEGGVYRIPTEYLK